MFCGYNIEVSTREYLKIQRTHQEEEEEKHRKKYKNKKKTSFLWVSEEFISLINDKVHEFVMINEMNCDPTIESIIRRKKLCCRNKS